MISERDNAGKPVSADWHRFREFARRTAMSPEEFSEITQTRYDLDTAQITGEQNPETWTGDSTEPKDAVDPSFDTRDFPWI